MREDISPYMSDQFFKDVKKGQVLSFNKDGEINRYKVVRLNRAKKICEVVPTKLYTEKEANEMLKKKMKLEDVLEHFKGQTLETTEDVARVLEFIGEPGKRRELKKQAVHQLFRRLSPQGFSVVESIESYEEY